MYSDRKGGRQKPPRTKPSRQNSSDKTTDKKPSRTKTNVCMHVLLKLGGGPRCVTYFWGVPRCVTKCDRGGVKIGPKLRDVLNGRPHVDVINGCCIVLGPNTIQLHLGVRLCLFSGLGMGKVWPFPRTELVLVLARVFLSLCACLATGFLSA